MFHQHLLSLLGIAGESKERSQLVFYYRAGDGTGEGGFGGKEEERDLKLTDLLLW